MTIVELASFTEQLISTVAELNDRGHQVTLYNRGKTPAQRLPGESEQDFEARKQQTKYIKGDRTNADALKELIDPSQYTYVYDMNGREATDTAPLADIFASPKSQLKSFVYMSCTNSHHLSLTQLPVRLNTLTLTRPS